MNSTLALEEEARDTSSMQGIEFPKWALPHVSEPLLESSSTVTAIDFPNGIGWYGTLTTRYFGSDLALHPEATQTTKVEYRDIDRTNAFLGTEGNKILGKVIELISDVSRSRDWSLSHVEVDFVEDGEVDGWQYVLVVLVFNCDFDTADRCLHELYGELDQLACCLDAIGQHVLEGKLFLDVATSIRVD